MILVRAAITLTWERDISSVTWYYKLQASTASTPAKPTAATPSGWMTTEPTYTEGSTNSLYIVQKTTFSDGTFEYSDVSLSSSYEAAKVAYNQSVSAKATADTALSQSIEYIVGSQTAATGSWKGETADLELRDGKTIMYKLPVAGKGNASLQLTLSDGTLTDNIPVYMAYSTSSNSTSMQSVTTHYPAGSVIEMTYDSSDERWKTTGCNSNINYVDRTQYGIALAASAAISAARIAVLGTDGKLHILNTDPFDMRCPPLYVATAYTAANVTSATTRLTNYCYWGTAFNLTNTHAVTGAVAGKPVYIVGTLSGDIFTPDSTVLTCTEPSTENGKYYMRLGRMSTTADAVLEMEHPIYVYYDGAFRKLSEAEEMKAAKSATNYIATDNTGLMVADMSGGTQYTPSNVPSGVKNTFIGNGSFNVRDGRTVLSSFGATASQIGPSTGKNVLVDTNGLKVRDGTTELASFGEDSAQIGKSSEGHIIVGSDEVLGSYLRMLNGNDIVFDVNDTYLETSNDLVGLRMDYGPDVDPLLGIYYNQAIKVGMQYNSSINKGELFADYGQMNDMDLSGHLDLSGNGNILRIICDSNSNRGLYDLVNSAWIIRKTDLGVILGTLAGNITIDKTEVTNPTTSEVTVIGSQGTNQLSLFANNHNGNNSGLFDHGNSQWVLEYDQSAQYVKILGAQIKEGASQAVANNLTTTAAGSVLDARQGKALADKLTAESYDFAASSYSKLVNDAVVSRFGKLGMLFLSSLTGLTANGDTDLGITLPAQYRPTRGIVQDCIVGGATPACLRVTISTAGKVTVHNFTTSTGTMNIRARIPYICAGT